MTPSLQQLAEAAARDFIPTPNIACPRAQGQALYQRDLQIKVFVELVLKHLTPLEQERQALERKAKALDWLLEHNYYVQIKDGSPYGKHCACMNLDAIEQAMRKEKA